MSVCGSILIFNPLGLGQPPQIAYVLMLTKNSRPKSGYQRTRKGAFFIFKLLP